MAGSRRPGPVGLGDEMVGRPHHEISVVAGWAAAWPTGLEPERLATKQAESLRGSLSFRVSATNYRVRRADGAKALASDEELVPEAEAKKLLAEAVAQPDAAAAELRHLILTGVPLSVVRVRLLTLTTLVDLSPPIEPPPPAPATRKPKEVKEGWIEIEVADEDGNLRGGDRYQLKLPDGRVVEGTIGPQGTISLHGIDPGNAELTFPDLDGRAWG